MAIISSGGLRDGEPQLPELIYANASPRSVGPESVFETWRPVTADEAQDFVSDEGATLQAVARLLDAGFDVLGVSPQTVNIAGPPDLYDAVFGVTLQPEERPVLKPGQVVGTATFVENPASDVPGLIETAGTEFGDVLEGVAIEEPVYWMGPSPFAPAKGYWHLRVPGDIAAGTGAEHAHRGGHTGRGVHVAMVDSGWYRHPFFTTRGYNVNPVVLGPGATDAERDESGHGTGESANLLAVAPDVEFTMVKMSFTNSLGAFNAAVALGPRVISCSWGSDRSDPPLSAAQQALAAAIALAVAEGIVVVFSAGNGHWGFPGQHPDVVSAGGVFMDDTGGLQASTYASGFASRIYSGRNVPDLSGLVGMVPRAAYIMLPVEPGDDIDRDLAGGTHPDGDETAPDDGWAAFSGTSAAAPQLAGAAALVLQANEELTPAATRSILMSTATDVTNGTNHARFGNSAGPGYDLATGAGLVDAHAAVVHAALHNGDGSDQTPAADSTATDGTAAEAPISASVVLNDPGDGGALARACAGLASLGFDTSLPYAGSFSITGTPTLFAQAFPSLEADRFDPGFLSSAPGGELELPVADLASPLPEVAPEIAAVFFTEVPDFGPGNP